MGKKADSGVNNVILIIASLALAANAAAAFLPMWVSFPYDGYTSFQQRNIGLLKVSGQFTPLMTTMADVQWSDLKMSTCIASSTLLSAGIGLQSVGALASVAMTAMQGQDCGKICKGAFSVRCTYYTRAYILNFVIIGLIVLGPLVSIVGGCMPMISKEKRNDKYTNFVILLAGALLSVGGVAAFYFIYNGMYSTFQQTGYFPQYSLGGAFYAAAGGSLLLVAPAFFKLKQAMAASAKYAAEQKAAEVAKSAALDPLLAVSPTQQLVL